MQVSIKAKGDYSKTINSLTKLSKREYLQILEECGRKGVAALSRATPRDTGATADSWEYVVEQSPTRSRIIWSNTNVTKTGEPIAIMLQYGHGTGTGGYVVGRDYINPAIRPIFDDISEEVRRALEV